MKLAIALIIIVMTIATGILLTVHVLRHKLMGWPIALGHGALGIIGVALIAGTAAPNDTLNQMALMAFILLLAVLLSGFYLTGFRTRRKLPPLGTLFLHAALGILAFAMAFAVAF